VKNNVLSVPDRRIIFLSETHCGSVHDKKICDEQFMEFPPGINLWQDTGFQGNFPENVNVRMPVKKPKGKELTEEQKKYNRSISSFRILVEHAIEELKGVVLSKNILNAANSDSMTWSWNLLADCII
jgi:hypothetical protein